MFTLRLALPLAVLTTLVAAVGTAGAEDPATPALPEPFFRAGDMAVGPNTKLPPGWSIVPEGGPIAEKIGTTVRDTLGAAGVPTGRIGLFVSQLRGPEGAEGALATLDTDPLATPGGPAAVATLLEAPASAQGWSVKPIGGPACALIVAGPAAAREALTQAALAWGAEGLTARALRVQQSGDLLGALATASLALTLEPRAALAHVVAGDVRAALVYQKRPHGSLEKALEHAEAALKDGAPYPITPQARTYVRNQKATALLMLGKVEAAYALYKELVADPALAADEGRWGTRYNFACAAARHGKLDEAFEHLGAVLAQDAEDTVRGIDHWREDPDFTALHADPRWTALLEKYPRG